LPSIVCLLTVDDAARPQGAVKAALASCEIANENIRGRTQPAGSTKSVKPSGKWALPALFVVQHVRIIRVGESQCLEHV
jgi:hypothetical protein